MTLISAVTYLCGALHGRGGFDMGAFVVGYLFVLLTQLSTHFLGEYYDRESDRLNRFSTVLTGGSKVLVDGEVSPYVALAGGWVLTMLALAVVVVGLPRRLRILALLMCVLANQYSGYPMKFNHRALGEVEAAIITNWLLPVFSFALQTPSFDPQDACFYTNELKLVIFTPAILKIGLFVLLNIADRRADWQGGKITIPVIVGDDNAARLHLVSVLLAHLIPFALTDYSSPNSIVELVLLQLAFPLGLAVSLELNFRRPYRCKHVTTRALLFSPAAVWMLFLHAVGTRVYRRTVMDWILPVAMSLLLLYLQLRGYFRLMSMKLPPEQKEVDWSVDGAESTVLIVGAGLSGLTIAACLEQLQIPYVVIERRDTGEEDGTQESGVMLTKSAVAMLETLGVPSPYLEVVSSLQRSDTTETELIAPCSKEKLLQSIAALVPRDRILYGNELVDLHFEQACVSATVASKSFGTTILQGRIIIGADGTYSRCRELVYPSYEVQELSRSLLQGIVPFQKTSHRMETLLRRSCGDFAPCSADSTTRIVVEDKLKLESCYGRFHDNMPLGIWFVSQELAPNVVEDAVQEWPEALASLYGCTDSDDIATYSINVTDCLPCYSSDRLVLLGDAAHLSSMHNLRGRLQAPSVAVEDAFFLAVQLRNYIGYGDGHAESFYRYERRHAYTPLSAHPPRSVRDGLNQLFRALQRSFEPRIELDTLLSQFCSYKSSQLPRRTRRPRQ